MPKWRRKRQRSELRGDAMKETGRGDAELFWDRPTGQVVFFTRREDTMNVIGGFFVKEDDAHCNLVLVSVRMFGWRTKGYPLPPRTRFSGALAEVQRCVRCGRRYCTKLERLGWVERFPSPTITFVEHEWKRMSRKTHVSNYFHVSFANEGFGNDFFLAMNAVAPTLIV